MGTTLAGIDVSAVGQGTAFDWAPYKGRLKFAFTKVSQGINFTDPAAKRNVAQMRADGIMPGGYHFLTNGGDLDGGAPQARAFWARAQAAGLGPGCLVAVDVEDGGAAGGTLAHFDLVAAGFINELHKLCGAWAIFYTEISLAPVMTHCGSSPLWLANPDGQHTGPIGPWENGVSFEQTGQRSVDTDTFYGSAAALAKLAVPKH